MSNFGSTLTWKLFIDLVYEADATKQEGDSTTISRLFTYRVALLCGQIVHAVQRVLVQPERPRERQRVARGRGAGAGGGRARHGGR